MSYKYFLPLDYETVYKLNPPFTYDYRPSGGSRHGRGKLDMGSGCDGAIIYSMTEGTVEGVGNYADDPNDPTTYCHIRLDNKILGKTAYIRYLHGDFDKSLEGKKISRGDKIGTVGTHGAGGYHLHVDLAVNPFSYNEYDFLGTLDFSNRTFTFDGVTYDLASNIDLDWIKTWNVQRSDNEYYDQIGYCWLIFAQQPQYLVPTDPGEKILINKDVYDNNPSDYIAASVDGINAYYNCTFTEDFIGPPPNSWDDFLNNYNLRCLVSFVRHEVGGWPFASAVVAKLMRATVLCQGYINISLHAAENTHNFQEWIQKGIVNSPWREGQYDGIGTAEENKYRGWIGSLAMNDGVHYATVQTAQVAPLTQSDLPWIQAVYNNFRYKDIYGAELEPNINADFKQAIVNFANGMVTENYFNYNNKRAGLNPYQYDESMIAYKSEYWVTSESVFVGYRHKNASITGTFNKYAYN